MTLDAGAKCAKALLVVFNFVFWLSGCFLLGLGIWLLVDPEKNVVYNLLRLEGHEPVLQHLAYALTGLGAFILLACILGCFGVFHENKYCLVTYFIALLIVLGAQVAIGVVYVLYRTQILEALDSKLPLKLQTDYGETDKQAFTDAVDYTQYKFNCCGIRGPEDYNNSSWKRQLDVSGNIWNVSMACCSVLTSTESDDLPKPSPSYAERCQFEAIENDDIRHPQGCKPAIQAWFEEENSIMFAVGVGVAGLEVFGMILAICLCQSLEEEEDFCK